MNQQRMLLVAVGCIVVWCSSSSLAEQNHPTTYDDLNDLTKSRQKRAWLTPLVSDSVYALAVVLAIPLELKDRYVFFSYNFETNYFLPYHNLVQGIVPKPFVTIFEADSNSDIVDTNNTPQDLPRSLDKEIKSTSKNISSIALNDSSTSDSSFVGEGSSTKTKSSKVSKHKKESKNVGEKDADIKRSENDTTKNPSVKLRRKSRAILEHLMTRARFYKMIENKMNNQGMRGRKCLQKAICDTSANPVTEHNGIIGDIVHIIFTPSTSKDEHLPRDLTEAELRGKSNNCGAYAKLCPFSVLDAISTYI